MTNGGALVPASTVYNGKKKTVEASSKDSTEVDHSGVNIEEVIKSNSPMLDDTDLVLYIEKEGSEYTVKSEEGKNLGSYKTKQEALDRLRAIEHFKNK